MGYIIVNRKIIKKREKEKTRKERKIAVFIPVNTLRWILGIFILLHLTPFTLRVEGDRVVVRVDCYRELNTDQHNRQTEGSNLEYKIALLRNFN